MELKKKSRSTKKIGGFLLLMYICITYTAFEWVRLSYLTVKSLLTYGLLSIINDSGVIMISSTYNRLMTLSLAVISVLLVIKMYKTKKESIKLLKLYFILIIIRNIVTIIRLWPLGVFLITKPIYIGVMILLIVYVTKSKRVKETFVN